MVIQVSVSTLTINELIDESLSQYNTAWVAHQIAYPVNLGKMDGNDDANPFHTYYAVVESGTVGLSASMPGQKHEVRMRLAVLGLGFWPYKFLV